MPYYYSVTRSATTNGTGNTCSNHVRLLAVANQQNCNVVQIMASVRNSTTAGSGFVSVVTSVANNSGAGGTAFTPLKANTNNPAAATTAFTDATSFTSFGAGFTRTINVGFAQTGGQGGWVALERDNAFVLSANATAASCGLLGLDSFTATASQLLELSTQFCEG